MRVALSVHVFLVQFGAPCLCFGGSWIFELWDWEEITWGGRDALQWSKPQSGFHFSSLLKVNWERKKTWEKLRILWFLEVFHCYFILYCRTWPICASQPWIHPVKTCKWFPILFPVGSCCSTTAQVLQDEGLVLSCCEISHNPRASQKLGFIFVW